MKKLTFFLSLLIFSFLAQAQSITGTWLGTIENPVLKLRIVFHLSEGGTGYEGTMDSPDQGAKGIPLDEISFLSDELVIRIERLGIEYTGVYDGEHIEGVFQQGSSRFPLNMQKVDPLTIWQRRPQEPLPPFPYRSEEVTFTNEEQAVQLAGTLTLPMKEGLYPAVILISGSGVQNRNEEVMGHKPFLLIADYLTRQGIAVLRYDDRGFTHPEDLEKGSTTADFATDAKAAMDWLKNQKDIDTNQIGLLGHSEGAIIAVMLAARIPSLRFIVLLGGTGVGGDQILLSQQRLIGKAMKMNKKELNATYNINKTLYTSIKNQKDPVLLEKELKTYLELQLKKDPERFASLKGETNEEKIQATISSLTDPWLQDFIRYSPSADLQKVSCPVLALGGEKDLQVDPDKNLSAIKKALEKGGNKQVTIHKIPSLNHLFQQAETGLPLEYGTIEQTISPQVLEMISKWIQKQTAHF